MSNRTDGQTDAVRLLARVEAEYRADPGVAAEAIGALGALVRSDPSAQVRAAERCAAGWIAWGRGALDEAIEAHRAALDEGLDPCDPVRLSACHGFGLACLASGRHADAFDVVLPAIHVAERCDEVRMASLAEVAGMLYLDRNDGELAAPHIEAAIAVYRRKGRTSEEGRALANLAIVHVGRQAWDDAEACYRAAAQRIDPARGAHNLAYIRGNLGELQLDRGRPAEALPHLDEAAEAHAAIGNEEGIAYTLLVRGRALMQLERPWEASETLRRAVAIFDAVGAAGRALDASTQLATALERASAHRDACAVLRDIAHRAEALRSEKEAERIAEVEARYELEARRRETERAERRADDLERARAEAAASAEARARFLAHFSHEIRTPLHAVLGFASLLVDDPAIGETQRDLADHIATAGRHLHELVDGVLELASIDAGRVDLAPRPLDIRALVNELRGVVGPDRGAGVELVVDVAPDVPDVLELDPGRLRQVLVNLVSNALRHTDEGSVTIAVTWDAPDRLVIDVRDTGPGIPTELHDRVFDAFEQGGTTDGRSGTGLGLAISRGLVDSMNGTLSVRDNEPRGTVFSFDVRTRAGTIADRRTARPVIADAPVVYVADDSATSRAVLKAMLTRAGCRVTAFEDGATLVHAVRRTPPHVVVVDMSMPGMDGETATRRLADMAPSTPVIAVTAHAFAEYERRMRDAGAVDFVTKPFRRDRIVEAVAAAAGRAVHWVE